MRTPPALIAVLCIVAPASAKINILHRSSTLQLRGGAAWGSSRRVQRDSARSQSYSLRYSQQQNEEEDVEEEPLDESDDDNEEEDGRFRWLRAQKRKLSNDIAVRVSIDPALGLKIRKSVSAVGTVVSVGADYCHQMGSWKWTCDVKDTIIGGRFSVNGRELRYNKEAFLPLPLRKDINCRYRIKLTIDLINFKIAAKAGLKATEQMLPNFNDGFPIDYQFDLQRLHKPLPPKVLLADFQGRFRLPIPNLAYNSDGGGTLAAHGDVVVNLEELNLRVNL